MKLYGDETVTELTNERYTMRQIAEIAGVSKIKVYRYIKANDISEVEVDGQALLYDAAAKDRIIAGVNGKSDNTSVKREVVATHAVVTPPADLLALLDAKEEQINHLSERLQQQDEQLSKQLDEKQKTIDDLNVNLQSMGKLMDQQQQLQLATQKQLENERARIGILKEGTSEKDDQLMAKDRQIMEKDKQINDLHEMLDNQHKFNLSIQDQLEKANKQHSWMFWKNK